MIQLKAAFAQYYDSDGSPLDGGYVYFGQAGQNPETHPVVVYSDFAATQPIAQPLRTSAGVVVRRGTPIRVYAPLLNYSVTVKNKRGVVIFSALDYAPEASEAVADTQAVADAAAQAARNSVQNSLSVVEQRLDGHDQAITNVAASYTIRTWATGQTYGPGTVGSTTDTRDVVLVGGVWYIATTDHTAGAVFADDLAAGRWMTTDPVQLRGDLATTGTDKGADMVAFQSTQVGAAVRTLFDRVNESWASVEDFRGDGMSDAETWNAALAALAVTGGTLVAPARDYTFDEQVEMNRRGLSGYFRQLQIIGYGCNLFTTGAISALRVRLTSGLYQTVIEGLTVNHRGNADALAGFELVGTSHMHLKNLSVEAHGVGANYAGILLRNDVASDNDTGCFWTIIEKPNFRRRSGGDVGLMPYGIRLQGASNATTIIGGSFVSCARAIGLKHETGQTYIANGVLVDGAWLEGNTTGVSVEAATTFPASGLRVVNCRAEGMTNFVSLTGATTQPAVPLYLSGNYMISSVTNYINNPNNLYVNNIDSAVTPVIDEHRVVNFKGHSARSLSTDFDCYTALAPNVGSGYGLKRGSDGAVMGHWRYQAFGGGVGSVVGGSASPLRPLGLTNLSCLSGTDTVSNNFARLTTWSGESTRAITFPVAEADASYSIFLSLEADVRAWVTSKTTAGFTINTSSGYVGQMRWMLVRSA